MRRYEEQMRAMVKGLLIGYGIGFAISAAIAIYSGIYNLNTLLEVVVLTLLFGSVISIFLVGSAGRKSFFLNLLYRTGSSAIDSIMHAGSGFFPYLVIKFIFLLIACVFICLFLVISFPFTILFTVIMYLIEKSGKVIDDGLADILEKIVPVISFVVMLFLLSIYSHASSIKNNKEVKEGAVSAKESSVMLQTEKNDENENIKNQETDNIEDIEILENEPSVENAATESVEVGKAYELPEETKKDLEGKEIAPSLKNDTEEMPEIASESPDSEDVSYEIPEVIKKLENRDNKWYIGDDELWIVDSTSPIMDKGDYYEVSNVKFLFLDSSNTDEDVDFPMTDKGYEPVTLRIRKSAIVETDSFSDFETEEMSAEEYYSKTGILSCIKTDDPDTTINTPGESNCIVFDDEGYVIRIGAFGFG